MAITLDGSGTIKGADYFSSTNGQYVALSTEAGSVSAGGAVVLRDADSSYQPNGVELYTGGLQRVGVDSAGRVTMPYQPMMQSAWTSAYLGMNGDIIRFATDLNIGGHYNTSTGTFTCPSAGKYIVDFGGMQSSGAGTTRVGVRKNGAQNSTLAYSYGQYDWCSLSIIFDCAANDTLAVSVFTGGIYAGGDHLRLNIRKIG